MENQENKDNLKYFNPAEYNTIVISPESSPSEVSLVTVLSHPDYKDKRHSVLQKIKEEKGLELLMQLIQKTQKPSDLQILIAACWEAGLNCSNHVKFFTQFAIHTNFAVALEAITVIETMERPFNNTDLKDSINILHNHSNDEEGTKTLLKNLEETLTNFLNT